MSALSSLQWAASGRCRLRFVSPQPCEPARCHLDGRWPHHVGLITLRRYVYAFYLPQQGNYRTHFEMNQTELEQQTEDLSGMLEKDVSDIRRAEVVHCFQVRVQPEGCSPLAPLRRVSRGQ